MEFPRKSYSLSKYIPATLAVLVACLGLLGQAARAAHSHALFEQVGQEDR